MIIPNIVTHKGTVARRCAGFAALLKIFNYAGEYIFLYSTFLLAIGSCTSPLLSAYNMVI